jgi:transposase
VSLKTPFPAEIPEETRRLVAPLLSEDSVYRLIGQEAGEMVGDEEFTDMYAEDGRPAVNAVLLAFITVFQFLEKLPDRVAARMAVMRLDWKYALRQEVDWTGFDYSDLCNFRKRLVQHGREGIVFEHILNYLRERGYVKAGGKQRTDSTHVVGQVMDLSRLELVWETIRVALNALISTDAPWVLKWLLVSFVETHSARRSDYRLSPAEVAEALQQAGEEGQWLWTQVMTTGTPILKALPELTLLKRVLDEHYDTPDEGNLQTRPPGQVTGDVITSPHDPEARYGNKGSHEWIGYKLHVTETVDEVLDARFITDMTITPAFIQDNTPLLDIQHRLIAHQVPPVQQYVDQGYMSGANLQSSLEQSIDLRGFVRDGNVTKPEGFRLPDFTIDVETHQATCPAGYEAIRWSPIDPKVGQKNLLAFLVSFGKQCQTCPFFGPDLCTDKPAGRTLGVSRYHDLIQTRRLESQSPSFRQDMHHRAAIEGTISELVRAHAARRSRYRGLPKNQLQAAFTAAATNLKRLARALASAFCSLFHVHFSALILSPGFGS